MKRSLLFITDIIDFIRKKIFTISEIEIKRRIIAFTAFLTSIYISFFGLSILIFPEFIKYNFNFLIPFAIGIFLLFALFRKIIVRFFDQFRKTKIILSDNYLERKTVKSSEKFLLKDITKIRIERTTRGDIREVGIAVDNKGFQYIDGLDNFESFAKSLIARCKKNVDLEKTKEPLDYDNVMFYPILGILVSTIFLLALKFFTGLNQNSLKIVFLIFDLYLFCMSGYFFIKKPLAIRYGYKSKWGDYFWGLFMVGAGIIIGKMIFKSL